MASRRIERFPEAARRVSALLDAGAVLAGAEAVDKASLLEDLVRALCRSAGLADAAACLERVREREKGIGTTLDTGLSLPHARVDGLDRVLAGLAVPKAPLPDPDAPELRIRAMFLFFSPNRQEFYPVHLQVLRSVSSLFKPDLLELIASARTPAEAVGLIRAREA